MPPIDQMTSLGTTIVDVNLKTGEVLTHPLESSTTTAKGVDDRFFGAPANITHVFTLRNGAPSLLHTWILDDHIENQFTFAIGTHLPLATGAYPQDTMGIYVYVVSGPTVTAGCTPDPLLCTVAQDSGYDGAYPFTSGTAQHYMFFKSVLKATDGVSHKGLDYTDQSVANGGNGVNYFRSLSFKTSALVTNFRFGVSVSAAVVKPNENRWKVTYVADSMPNRVGMGLAQLRSEPDWRVQGSAGSVSDTSIQPTVTAGCPAGAARCFRISSADPSTQIPTDTIRYFRSDSLATGDKAYISADLAMGGNLRPNNPSVFIAMHDGVRKMLIGFSQQKVGFCDTNNLFLPMPNVPVSLPAGVTNWRLAKFGADSVALYGGGAPTAVVRAAYSSLPASTGAAVPTAFFSFGNRALLASPNPTGVISLWSNVTYEIGATGP